MPEGALLIDARATEIEGQPAGIVEFKMGGERVGMSFFQHTWAISFVSGRTLVMVQFQVGGGSESADAVSRRMASFKPLFTLMANSIVLPEKWSK